MTQQAAYICKCSDAQLNNVGCDCAAGHFKIVEVDIQQVENGSFSLTFNGKMRGDAVKFSKSEAYRAAAAWDGKETGEWCGNIWQPVVYRCAWGAGVKA